jgi:hypothetical protein
MKIRMISAVVVSVLTLSVISGRADEVVITGKVIRTRLSNAQQFKFVAFESKDMGKDEQSIAVIYLENRDRQEFAIPTDSLFELEGLKDLTGQDAHPSKSRVLARLKQALTGKNVELTCLKAGMRQGITIFAVKAINLPKD